MKSGTQATHGTVSASPTSGPPALRITRAEFWLLTAFVLFFVVLTTVSCAYDCYARRKERKQLYDSL